MKDNCKLAKGLQAIWQRWICPADFLKRIRTLLILFVIDFTLGLEGWRRFILLRTFAGPAAICIRTCDNGVNIAVDDFIAAEHVQDRQIRLAL